MSGRPRPGADLLHCGHWLPCARCSSFAVAILVPCQRGYISMRPSGSCTPSSVYALGASEYDVYERAKDSYRGG
jgi:hypothetical protein